MSIGESLICAHLHHIARLLFSFSWIIYIFTAFNLQNRLKTCVLATDTNFQSQNVFTILDTAIFFL